MNNDFNISSIFKEKNKEIFKNSLSLEMDRNLDTLKNTTDNYVALEINKLFLFFKSFFSENNIDVKKEELLGFLYKERNELNRLINEKIELKKKRIKENFLEAKIEDEVLTKEYLDKYFEELDKETDDINSEIELSVSDEIITNFSQNVIKKFNLNNEDQLDRINSRVNVLFKNNIISKIIEQTKFRDNSLKNLALESFNKYLDLNKNTIE